MFRYVIFILLTSVFFIFEAQIVFAHGGRTDSCGGHNDRKHGGYHIHNLSKYCTCYPQSEECNKNSAPVIKDKEITTLINGVAPADEWNCPETHSIKGNIDVRKGTMIFHLPSGAYYTRTKPERCYSTEENAVADGFRQSKR